MKQKQFSYSLLIAVVMIPLVVFISCHSPKPLEKSPDKKKPAAHDSSANKMDTGPSEFFDGAGINVTYPDAGFSLEQNIGYGI